MGKFPEGFLWGAATAAHQVEGNNINSDLWVMEHIPGSSFKEPSGDACDHYRLFRSDIQMIKDLGLNAYRFSIEWARIEPEQGFFSKAALAHYREVLETCHELGITPMITLHHFSSPRWLMRLGGWEGGETPERFARYCQVVAQELGELMPYVCTINEANITVIIRQMIAAAQRNVKAQAPIGVETQHTEDPRAAFALNAAQAFNTTPEHVKPFLFAYSSDSQRIVMEAHERGRDAIKAANPNSQVGLTIAIYDVQALPGGEAQAEAMREEIFYSYLPACQGDDFLGVQNYSRKRVGPEGPLGNEEGVETTQMGYEFYPDALEAVLRMVSQHFKQPIMVTENGIATSDDSRRTEFIRRALSGVQRCLADGLDVRGYFHWTLLDNFEWTLGYRPTFGLVAVDRETQQRSIKESAYYLGRIACNNSFPGY